MAGEGPEAEGTGGEGRSGDGDGEIVKAGVPHRLEVAGPAPVRGDEGADDGAQGLGEREDGAGEWELESDEVHGDKRGLAGGARPGGDGEADGGHGAIGEAEVGELAREAAREAADEFHEDAHPGGLGRDEREEEHGFGGEMGGGTEAGELLFLVDEALGDDLAGGVIGTHEGEKDHLKHREAGDEAADLAGLDSEVDGLAELFEDVDIDAHVEVLDLGQTLVGEEDDDAGEGEGQEDLKPDLAGAPEEQAAAAGEEFDKLREAPGDGGSGRGRCGMRVLVGGFVVLPVLACGYGVRGEGLAGEVGAVLEPELTPFVGLAGGELGVDLLGVGDLEIMEQEVWWAVVDEPAAVEQRDGVVEVDVPEAMGDVEDEPAGIERELAHEVDEVVFGLGVEAAGDLVAEQQARVGDQLDGEAEAALLPAGEEADGAIGDAIDADGLKDLLDAGGAGAPAQAAHAEPGGRAEVFSYREPGVRDAELRDVAELGGREVLLVQIVALPEDLALGGLDQSRDGAQQRGFPATRGADDGAEVGVGKCGGDALKQGMAFGGHRHIEQFKHAGGDVG